MLGTRALDIACFAGGLSAETQTGHGSAVDLVEGHKSVDQQFILFSIRNYQEVHVS